MANSRVKWPAGTYR